MSTVCLLIGGVGKGGGGAEDGWGVGGSGGGEPTHSGPGQEIRPGNINVSSTGSSYSSNMIIIQAESFGNILPEIETQHQG